jgi:uncharacterized protein YlxW (UPF0749 family)
MQPIGHLVATLITAQADASGVPAGVAATLGILAAVGTALFVWAFLQLRSVRQRLNALTVEHRSTTDAHRALMDKERKQSKKLETKRDDVKDLKRDLAAQKKKNHTLQQELKQLRTELRDQTQAAAKARTTRPAFSEAPAKVAKAVEEDRPPKPETKPEPPKVEEAKPAQRAEADDAKLNELLTKERETVKSLRAELKKLRRRAEDLRRVDLITKSQAAVLEDKVRTLGRQYYDAVSELAALKGEVAPPPPRDGVPAPRLDETAALDAAVAGDDVSVGRRHEAERLGEPVDEPSRDAEETEALAADEDESLPGNDELLASDDEATAGETQPEAHGAEAPVADATTVAGAQEADPASEARS